MSSTRMAEGAQASIVCLPRPSMSYIASPTSFVPTMFLKSAQMRHSPAPVVSHLAPVDPHLSLPVHRLKVQLHALAAAALNAPGRRHLEVGAVHHP